MAEAADVATLARKLRGKGLTDDQVRESLTGLGYSKTQAGQAVASIGGTSATPAAPAKKAQPKMGRSTSGTPSTGAPAGPAAASPPAAGSSGVGGGSGFPGMPKMPTPSMPSLTLTPPRRLSSGDLGGFAAGLLVYTLALNYLRYGSGGVTGWLRAKFLNQPAEGIDPPANRTTAEDYVNATVAEQGLSVGRVTTRPRPPRKVN